MVIHISIQRMILAFVGWLVTVRKVCSDTISKYLSGLRVVHLKNGVLPTNLRPDIVKAILKGREHMESGTKIPRLAMTIPVMRLLRQLIKMSKMTESKKRLIWAVCCIAFNGSFRTVRFGLRPNFSFIINIILSPF